MWRIERKPENNYASLTDILLVIFSKQSYKASIFVTIDVQAILNNQAVPWYQIKETLYVVRPQAVQVMLVCMDMWTAQVHLLHQSQSQVRYPALLVQYMYVTRYFVWCWQ